VTAQQWIRIVIVIGSYLLLRPYLLKWAGRAQEKQHEKMIGAEEKGSKAKISANSLRGQVEVPDDTDEEAEGQATGANWGKKARKRQRWFVNKALEEDERRRMEEQDELDDKEVEDFLVRYTSIKTELEEEEEI